MNEVLAGRLGSQYVTAAYLFLDLEAGLMRYSAAGHPPLLRWRHGETSAQEIEPSAEEAVLTGVEYGDLAGALNRLSPELRAVVQATILDDLTTKEAGRLLGIPAGTVKTRMMRARAQLREELA